MSKDNAIPQEIGEIGETKNQKDLMKWFSWITAVLVIAIAASSFWLSFNALYSLAVSHYYGRSLGYLFPLVIDGAMIVFSLSALRGTLAGEKTWWLWSLIISFTAGSMILNALHIYEIDTADITGMAIAAVIPLITLLTFETLMNQVKSGIATNVSRLKQYVTELEQTITDLKQTITGMKQTITDLKQVVTDLKQRVTDLKQSETELKRRVTKLEQAEAALKQTIAKLERENDMLLKNAIPETVGKQGKDLLSVIDGNMKQVEFAEKWGQSKATVSRTVQMLNGGTRK